MRFSKLAIASVFALAACGGEKTQTETQTQTPAVTPPPVTAAAPITGETKVVQMVGDEKGTRFEPAAITIKAGDGIRFDVISMPPHNVAFDPAVVTEPAKSALKANMPEQISELSGKLLNAAGESYTISFANVPAGVYEAICTPHLATNMKMKITVQ
jgi:plastocyanin